MNSGILAGIGLAAACGWNTFTPLLIVALADRIGVSLNENNFGGQSTDRTVAGRAGVQVSW